MNDGVGRCGKPCSRTSSCQSGELAEHVRGNEQATKQSLVGPLFTTLGYDLTDPRECLPEYRVNFGPNRSVGPVDRVFLQNGHPIFAVQAKASALLDLAGRSRPRDPSDGCRMGLRPPTGGGGRADVTASWRRTFGSFCRIGSSPPTRNRPAARIDFRDETTRPAAGDTSARSQTLTVVLDTPAPSESQAGGAGVGRRALQPTVPGNSSLSLARA